MPANLDPESYIREAGVDVFNKIIANSILFLDYIIFTELKTEALDCCESKSRFVQDLRELITKLPNYLTNYRYKEALNAMSFLLAQELSFIKDLVEEKY